MKFIFTFILLSSIIFSIDVNGQEFYNIRFPEEKFNRKCQDCIDLLKNKPKEIQFGVKRDEYNNLFFVVTRQDWFDLLMKKRWDGIAIDIVTKDRYDCSNEKLEKKSYFIGDLQRPIYLKEIKRNTLKSKNDKVVIRMGKLPNEYIGKDIEFNIAFIKKKYLCYYSSFSNLKTYRWDLLDMGFYFDTLTYKQNFDSTLIERESYLFQHKVLRFEIPFDQNKSEYSNSDIRPLYDSLNITDFNIKKITIRSYSSIEGNERRNTQLQKARAESIVEALQTYQKPSIVTEISVSENWVDFLNDISSTSYSYLSDLSKQEIKNRLKSNVLEKELEPYFKKHRKAVIVLELQKKNKYKNIPVAQLIDLFSESISEKNLTQSIEIQNSIFEKVRNHEIPINYIDKLEIPIQNEFGLLLNKNSIFKYLMDETGVYEAYNELNTLQDLIPNDAHLKYNICALKIKVWILGRSAINPQKFKKEIKDLRKWGIPNNLVKRMLVNYEIIMSEYHMKEGEFAKKDKSLRYIYSNYKYLPLSDADYLSLAQYFASFAKYDWAIKLLGKRVNKIDVNEDLLFYYLNLTIIDQKKTKRSSYRIVMLNAINLNNTRFCEIFEPSEQGGLTFQLLENEYLRKIYCENCN